MENMNDSGSASQPPISTLEHEVEANGVNRNTSQPPTVPGKKRKVNVEPRSPVWAHFEKIKDKDGKLIKAKCLYCPTTYMCQSKKHGTSSLRNHMLNCLKNPASIESRQSRLNFQPVPNSQSNEVVLGTWVFNQEEIRKALAEMIIIDELVFRFVEGQRFRRFIVIACPRFKVPSRWTVSRDIYSIYLDERVNLKKFFRANSQRISITTDTWTSIQRINYMCITAHFIDNYWNLHKKILSFVPVTSHKGEYISKALEACLLEWGLKSVFTVTVDNASSNDTALVFLKKKVVSWGSSAVKSKYLHMRCIAHILNLVVQDGLKEARSSVHKVREAVKYIRNSPQRLQKFKDIADLVEVETKCALSLDVQTRWNSTYLMFKTSLLYQKAFESYEENERDFSKDLGEDVPDFMD